MSTWERRSNNTKWLTNVCFASCLHDSIKSLGGVAKGHVVGEVELLLLLVRHGENEFESRLLPGDVRLVRSYPDRFKSYLNQKLTLHLRISLDYNQCAIASVDHLLAMYLRIILHLVPGRRTLDMFWRKKRLVNKRRCRFWLVWKKCSYERTSLELLILTAPFRIKKNSFLRGGGIKKG